MGQIQYFLDWEVELDGSELAERFLRAQIVEKSALQRLRKDFYTPHLVIEFDDSGKMVSATVKEIGEYYEDENGIEEEEESGYIQESLDEAVKLGKQRFVDYAVNHLFEFTTDDNGLNYLGGEAPPTFRMPELDSQFPVQYLGMLSHQDQAFSHLLDFDFHMMCPLYLGFNHLWVDYKNPEAPVFYNNDELSGVSAIHDIPTDTIITYEKIRFSTEPWPYKDHGGHTGAAVWVQEPDIPICPKTGESMSLLCQLDDNVLHEDLEDPNFTKLIPKVAHHNLDFDKLKYPNYFKSMNLTGYLYIYYCQNSKMARYSMQST